MKAKVVKIEGRLAVFVPEELVAAQRISEGDEVSVSVEQASDIKRLALEIMARRHAALAELAK
ncbi:MAG: hypothetical protein MRY63_00335 [Neomegalonema sp.]|nr:hypothetical protein [Neomegalonema sp.]